jgi:hypothetical protein
MNTPATQPNRLRADIQNELASDIGSPTLSGAAHTIMAMNQGSAMPRHCGTAASYGAEQTRANS